MISEDRLQKALVYLAESDSNYGKLRGRVEGIEYRLKVAEAQGIIESQGKGNAEFIKSLSRASDKYRALVDEFIEAKTELETIAAKRKTEEIIISIWQSINANKRAGMIK